MPKEIGRESIQIALANPEQTPQKTTIGVLTVKISEGGRRTLYLDEKYASQSKLKALFEQIEDGTKDPVTYDAEEMQLIQIWEKEKVIKAFKNWKELNKDEADDIVVQLKNSGDMISKPEILRLIKEIAPPIVPLYAETFCENLGNSETSRDEKGSKPIKIVKLTEITHKEFKKKVKKWGVLTKGELKLVFGDLGECLDPISKRSALSIIKTRTKRSCPLDCLKASSEEELEQYRDIEKPSFDRPVCPKEIKKELKKCDVITKEQRKRVFKKIKDSVAIPKGELFCALSGAGVSSENGKDFIERIFPIEEKAPEKKEVPLKIIKSSFDRKMIRKMIKRSELFGEDEKREIRKLLGKGNESVSGSTILRVVNQVNPSIGDQFDLFFDKIFDAKL